MVTLVPVSLRSKVCTLVKVFQSQKFEGSIQAEAEQIMTQFFFGIPYGREAFLHFCNGRRNHDDFGFAHEFLRQQIRPEALVSDQEVLQLAVFAISSLQIQQQLYSTPGDESLLVFGQLEKDVQSKIALKKKRN